MAAIIRSHNSYIGKAFEPATIVAEAEPFRAQFEQVDSLVGTGMSGSIVVPVLAHHFGIDFAIVRKDDDVSNHDYNGPRLRGNLGRTWLFVDDLIASGDTLRSCEKAVENIAVIYGTETPTLVGVYLYGHPGERARFNQYVDPTEITTPEPEARAWYLPPIEEDPCLGM